MNCYSNQPCPQSGRPDIIVPPPTPPQPRPSTFSQNAVLGASNFDSNPNFPVGMTYVPWQQWQQTYPINQGFYQGTIFPDLDKPFFLGRCR